MEALRWILIGAGILFVLFIYLWGRNRSSQIFGSTESESEELPEFSANNGDDVDDNIDDVHISARAPDDVFSNAYDEDESAYDELGDNNIDRVGTTETENELSDGEQVIDEGLQENQQDNRKENSQDDQVQDIIALTVISRTEEGLHGDRINSAFIGNNLKFGDMGIFHRMGEDAKPMFSVANLVEPGSFDPDAIHELRTSGLTFFMQLPVYGGALNALTDMLQCAYKISELLDADLCDKKRNPLTESDAESLRDLASEYDSE